MKFDVSRANLRDKAQFKPFQVTTFLDCGDLLNSNTINEDEGILVFELNKKHYGFLRKQMAYHHVANGDIDGEPFMVSF